MGRRSGRDNTAGISAALSRSPSSPRMWDRGVSILRLGRRARGRAALNRSGHRRIRPIQNGPFCPTDRSVGGNAREKFDSRNAVRRKNRTSGRVDRVVHGREHTVCDMHRERDKLSRYRSLMIAATSPISRPGRFTIHFRAVRVAARKSYFAL